jgi:hypothetical protein
VRGRDRRKLLDPSGRWPRVVVANDIRSREAPGQDAEYQSQPLDPTEAPGVLYGPIREVRQGVNVLDATAPSKPLQEDVATSRFRERNPRVRSEKRATAGASRSDHNRGFFPSPSHTLHRIR